MRTGLKLPLKVRRIHRRYQRAVLARRLEEKVVVILGQLSSDFDLTFEAIETMPDVTEPEGELFSGQL
jgi:hypothetical protein